MNYSENEYSGSRTDNDATIAAALELLPRIGPALFGSISRLAQAHRLTPAQMKVVLQVGTHGQMTIGDLADRLGVSMPSTSEIVDRLVDAGHLVRASDPADRRRVLIAATPEAREISKELDNVRRKQLQHALDQLTPAERPYFERSLQALLYGLCAVDRGEAGYSASSARVE
jgi:DNA-binding MarR family transcriptional regulator